MSITLNLTAVLITAIICLTLCYVCKSGKDEKKAEKEPEKKTEPLQKRRVTKPITVYSKEEVERMEDQARKRGDIEP